LTQAYTPGDVFEAADENILILVNTVIDGYAVTLRQPAAPISGSFTLGSITFAANTSGMATFRLDEFTLGDIYGRAIPNVIALDPDTTITIVDS
jgi:hypothetical protein